MKIKGILILEKLIARALATVAPSTPVQMLGITAQGEVVKTTGGVGSVRILETPDRVDPVVDLRPTFVMPSGLTYQAFLDNRPTVAEAFTQYVQDKGWTPATYAGNNLPVFTYRGLKYLFRGDITVYITGGTGIVVEDFVLVATSSHQVLTDLLGGTYHLTQDEKALVELLNTSCFKTWAQAFVANSCVLPQQLDPEVTLTAAPTSGKESANINITGAITANGNTINSWTLSVNNNGGTFSVTQGTGLGITSVLTLNGGVNNQNRTVTVTVNYTKPDTTTATITATRVVQYLAFVAPTANFTVQPNSVSAGTGSTINLQNIVITPQDATNLTWEITSNAGYSSGAQTGLTASLVDNPNSFTTNIVYTLTLTYDNPYAGTTGLTTSITRTLTVSSLGTYGWWDITTSGNATPNPSDIIADLTSPRYATANKATFESGISINQTAFGLHVLILPASWNHAVILNAINADATATFTATPTTVNGTAVTLYVLSAPANSGTYTYKTV
jgi:hypothetical protein